MAKAPRPKQNSLRLTAPIETPITKSALGNYALLEDEIAVDRQFACRDDAEGVA